MNRPLNILIIAGEVSGDMHAAGLVQALKKRAPGARFFGIGGDRMREAGVELRYHVRDTAVMGFSEIVHKLAFFRRVFYEMLDLAKAQKPDAVILVDYPGFNLRFARRVHALGIKVIYYICPQVWAWHRSRIPKMARVIDRLITIFPFEGQHFDGTGLTVDFVGHPLVDEAREELAQPVTPLPWKGEPRVALLPGSRGHVISHVLPTLWETATLIGKSHPKASFIIPCPSTEVEKMVRSAIGKRVVSVDCIGMVNIIAGRTVCPEFIQEAATPPALAAALDPLLGDTPARAAMLEALREVTRRLGDGGAADRAAESVLKELAHAPLA